MINRKLLLSNSLFIFLMHCEEINFDFDNDKPLIEYVEEDNLLKFDVLMSLMKWEVHHGLKIDPESYIKLSINEIIDITIEQPELTEDEYLEHLFDRLNEIKEAYYNYYTAAEEYVKECDSEAYLRNKN